MDVIKLEELKSKIKETSSSLAGDVFDVFVIFGELASFKGRCVTVHCNQHCEEDKKSDESCGAWRLVKLIHDVLENDKKSRNIIIAGVSAYLSEHEKDRALLLRGLEVADCHKAVAKNQC